MNARMMTVVAAVSLLVLSGCSGGLRNMMFGRGAACGACAAAAPQYHIAPPAPCGVPQGPCASPLGACGGGQCGSGYGGPGCGYGGVNAYAPAMEAPYVETIPGADYPGGSYGYPAPVPGNWVPAGEAVVPGSAYMSEPLTPMTPPAR